MSRQNSSIDWDLRFKINKQDFTQVKKELEGLQEQLNSLAQLKLQMANAPYQTNGEKDVLDIAQRMKEIHTSREDFKKLAEEQMKAANEISKLMNVLDKSFNKDLGTLNLKTFNKAVEETQLDLKALYKSMNSDAAPDHARKLFRDLTTDILSTNVQLKQTSALFNSLMVSLKNTVQWGITSSIFNSITNSIQGAWTYAKKLDTSLNDIRIVTGKSGDEMERFAREANKAAQALGKTTTDYTEASLIYYQQGLSEEEVQARTETTLKTANVTGQSTSSVSEQLTAVWNGYKVSAEEAERYIDKLTAVAAATASDLEELSTGMSKVASAANLMGVDIDQLSSQMATIISVTRQAPESVGTALKTIYARMGDIEAGIDTEATLGEYTAEMAEMGVNVLDANGSLRDMGEVIEEIGEKWSSLSREQQIALSQTMAGTRQYNNLLALFDNWDEYTKTLQISQTAFGTLQKQQDIYMESSKAHLEQLEGAWENLFDAFFDNKGMNSFFDMLTSFVNFLGDGLDGIGGGFTFVLGAAGTLTKLLKHQLGPEVAAIISNFRAVKKEGNIVAEQYKVLQSLVEAGINPDKLSDNVLETIVGMKKTILDYGKTVSDTEHNEINYLIKVRSELEKINEEYEERKKNVNSLLELVYSPQSQGPLVPDQDLGDGTPLTAGETFDEKSLFSSDTERKLAMLQELENAFGDTEHHAKDFSKTMTEVEKTWSTIISTMDYSNEAFEKAFDNFINLDAEFQDILITLENMQENGDVLQEVLSGESYGQYLAILDTIKQKPQLFSLTEILMGDDGLTGDGTYDYAKERILKIVQIYEEATKNVKTRVKEANDFIKKDGQQTAEDIKSKIEDVKKAFNHIEENLRIRKITEETFSLIGSLSQLVSIVSMFSNSIKTLGDDSVSAGDKIATGTTALVSGGLMTYSLAKKAGPELIQLGAAMGVEASSAALAAGETATLGEAFSGAMAGLGAVLPYILGAVGVIAALGAIIWGVYKVVNKNNEALEGATKIAQNLTNTYTELASAANELKESVSDYSKGIEELEKLGENTKEYKEALDAANESAKKLIESNHLIYGQDYTVQNGLTTIGQDVLDDIQLKAEHKALDAEMNAYYAQGAVEAQRMANDIDKSEAKNVRKDFSKDIMIWVENALGEEQYVLHQNQFKDDKFSDEEYVDIARAFYQLKQATGNQYKAIVGDTNALRDNLLQLENVPPVVHQNISAIVDNAKAFKDLSETLEGSLKDIDNFSKTLLKSAIEKEFNADILELATDVATGEINYAIAEQLEEIYAQSQEGKEGQKIISDAISATKQEEIVGWRAGLFYSELKDRYGDEYDVEKYHFKDKDKGAAYLYAEKVLGKNPDAEGWIYEEPEWGSGSFKDKNGNLVMNSLTDKQMTEQIAMVGQREQGMEGSTKKLSESSLKTDLQNIMEKGTVAGQKYGIDFTNALLNVITESSHQMDLSKLFVELSPSEVQELLNLDEEHLQEMFGFSEDELKRMGYESWEEFKAGFDLGLSSYKFNLSDSIDHEIGQQFTDEEEEFQEQVKVHAKQLAIWTKNEKEFSDTLAEDAEAAVLVSGAMIKMNQGIQTLHDNMEDWTTVLNENKEMSVEYALAIEGISEALGDVLGVESQYINTEFVQNHLADIKLAADGDVAAIERLRNELLDDIVVSFGQYKGLDQSIINGVKSDIDKLQDSITDFQIGVDFQTGGLTDAEKNVLETMNHIIKTCQLGTDEANAIFRTMGYSVEYEQTSAPTEAAQIPVTVTESEITSLFPLKMTSRTYQDGTESLNGQVSIGSYKTVTADGKEGEVQTPTVVNATRLAGASYSNAPTSKSGSKSNKPSKMDSIKIDLDRFHDIDIVLSDIQNDLERIENAQSKAFGKELLEEYNKELKALDKNLVATDKKIKIAEEWMSDLRQGNAAMGIDKGLEAYGVQFDEDGYVTNYEELFLKKQRDIQALIDRYNAMAEGDAKEEYKENVVEPAQDEFETFKELFEKYEELKHETIPELLKNKEDDINKQIETQIEKFNTEITIRLDLKEAEEDWNDFRRNVLEDLKDSDVLRNAELDLENFSLYYKDNENGIIQAGTRQVNNILAELKSMDETGWSQVYGDNRVQALEDLKTYYDQLRTDLTDINTLIEDIQQSYVDMMEQAGSAFDEQVKTYKQISSLLEHDMKIVKLVNGDNSYAELDKYYEKLEKNNRKQLDFQRQEVEFWKNEMDNLDPIADEEAWEKARDNWTAAINELNSQIESSIENLQDKYLNSIEKIFDELNDKITNGKGLDYVSEEWDLLGQNSDEFLDEINALYGIEDIARKYQDAINDTDDLAVQKKLKDVMEQEVEALKEKDKLTEYDIERAEKKYELTLKQIALEEAQQNKSQLRLRRDSQGNYTYQYVADEDEVSKLEEELAAAQNELYNFDLEQYKDKLEQVYDAYEEFQDKMKEAAQINDPEERAERELLLQQQYGELINGLVAQNEDIRNNLYESAFTELAALRNQDLTDYTNLTQKQKDLLMNDLIPQWNSGIQEMVDTFAGEGGFIPTCSEAMEELEDATAEYEKELDQLEKAAGVDFDDISDGIDQTIKETQRLLEKNDDLISKYEEEMDSIGNLMDDLDALIEKYEDARIAAEEATEAAYNYWRTANEDAAGAAKEDKYYQHEAEDISLPSSSIDEPIAVTNEGDGEISVGDTVTFIGGSGRWYADSFGGGTSGTSSSDRQVTITRINTSSKATYPYHIDQLGWVKKSQLKGYDTGGYTGAWGDEGRLALLHQKELVLNAQDTQNMLSAVDILRDITNSIGNTMLNRLAQLNAGAKGVLANSEKDALEQNVHIEATFPNVQNSNEIEEALGNLINIAAQRAYRT